MALLVVYADASMDAGIVTVAGYLANGDDWDLGFVPAWRAMLEDPTWPGGRVKEFKTSDCRNGGGEFRDERGWTESDRHRLRVRAGGIITSVIPHENLVGLGAAIELPPVAAKDALEAYERFAFYMCFEHLVANVLRITRYHLQNKQDEVRFIFDEQKGYEGVAREQFEKARANVGVGIRHRIARPLFEQSVNLLPLQAADFLAHETYKEIRNRREGRKLSGALRALVKGRVHHGDFIDAATFALLEKASREGTLSLVGMDRFPGPMRLYDSYQPLRGEEGASE